MNGGGVVVNDHVQLSPRESPYGDQPEWWWRVTRISEYGLDAVYERDSEDGRSSEVLAVRLGVAPGLVRGHRTRQR